MTTQPKTCAPSPVAPRKATLTPVDPTATPDSAKDGVYCDHCGAPLAASASYCDGCGNRLPGLTSGRRWIVVAMVVAVALILALAVGLAAVCTGGSNNSWAATPDGGADSDVTPGDTDASDRPETDGETSGEATSEAAVRSSVSSAGRVARSFGSVSVSSRCTIDTDSRHGGLELEGWWTFVPPAEEGREKAS